MFEFIRGKIFSAAQDVLVVEASGIGYRIEMVKNAFPELSVGDEILVFVDFSVSENHMALYGFPTPEHKSMYALLKTVTSIGPKVAVGILGCLSVSDLALAIRAKDIPVLTRCPGVGKKTAERIVLELGEKVDVFCDDTQRETQRSAAGGMEELVEALEAFGFTRGEIEKQLEDLDISNMSVEAALKVCLRSMQRG